MCVMCYIEAKWPATLKYAKNRNIPVTIIPNSFNPANNEQAEARFIHEYCEPINHTPTHRINLFSPRFHFHYARNEWYAIIVGNSRGWVELIVRTSHGVPYDSFYRLRKVASYKQDVAN